MDKGVYIFEKNQVLGTASMSGVEYDIKQTETHWKLVGNGRVKVSFEWSKKDFVRIEDFISMLSQEGYKVSVAG